MVLIAPLGLHVSIGTHWNFCQRGEDDIKHRGAAMVLGTLPACAIILQQPMNNISRAINEIDKFFVQETIHNLPQLFQIWAAKHINNIAGTMTFLSHQDGRSKLCPSCQMCEETCQHIARCPEKGRTLAFEQSANNMERRLKSRNTHPDIQNLLLRYLCGRGSNSCFDCATALDLPPIMQRLGISRDIIGGGHIVMGMVFKQIAKIQSAYLLRSNSLWLHHHGSWGWSPNSYRWCMPNWSTDVF
jgi:hypothetical protein